MAPTEALYIGGPWSYTVRAPHAGPGGLPASKVKLSCSRTPTPAEMAKMDDAIGLDVRVDRGMYLLATQPGSLVDGRLVYVWSGPDIPPDRDRPEKPIYTETGGRRDIALAEPTVGGQVIVAVSDGFQYSRWLADPDMAEAFAFQILRSAQRARQDAHNGPMGSVDH